MRVALIHNPCAGEGDPSDAKDLLSLMRSCGHHVNYRSSQEDKWETALAAPTDVVAVAGDDGTVSKVAHCLLGKDIPLAILPRGNSSRKQSLLWRKSWRHLAAAVLTYSARSAADDLSAR
jgi:diacylglycerol kinase (ATP)